MLTQKEAEWYKQWLALTETERETYRRQMRLEGLPEPEELFFMGLENKQ